MVRDTKEQGENGIMELSEKDFRMKEWLRMSGVVVTF